MQTLNVTEQDFVLIKNGLKHCLITPSKDFQKGEVLISADAVDTELVKSITVVMFKESIYSFGLEDATASGYASAAILRTILRNRYPKDNSFFLLKII